MFLRALGAMAGMAIVFGVLSIAIFVTGAILGLVLSFLIPVGLLFTGVGLAWFLLTDFSKEKPKSK
jgi:cytochrome c biogenesis protein CcdA